MKIPLLFWLKEKPQMKDKHYTEEQIIWNLTLGLQATVDTVGPDIDPVVLI